MNIVFATSEMSPFAKTGGLADVCGSLPLALARKGHTVHIFLPKYKMVDTRQCVLVNEIHTLSVQLGKWTYDARIYRYDYQPRVHVYFIEHNGLFHRDGLYGTSDGDYIDNDERFIFYQRVVLEAVKKMGVKPAIMHCHDWQTALIPVYLKTIYNDDFYRQTKSFFTIHNLAYQGIFPSESFQLTGLPASEFTMNRLEFFGNLNCMKGGIVYADVVTTVSERYAQEIQLKELGCGLDGVLRARKGDVFGIVNGIDTTEWNPEIDQDITVQYTVKHLDKKLVNKGVLQKENQLPVDRDTLVIGMVTRMVDQKGFDLLFPLLPELMRERVQLIILGTGDDRYHRTLKEFAARYPDRVSVNIVYDAQMARRIYAGSDLFLMPSRFEPCGLGQLISLRYGTVPLVRETGGLADTIMDFNPKTGKGNGIVFSEYTKEALLKALHKAIGFYQDKTMWKLLMTNAMNSDNSWDVSADKYIRLYEKEKRKDII